MRRNPIIKQIVITALLMPVIVILINCKGRADKEGSDVTEVKADKTSDEKAGQPPADIDENGTVWIWGDNSRGQLGDGTLARHLSKY